MKKLSILLAVVALSVATLPFVTATKAATRSACCDCCSGGACGCAQCTCCDCATCPHCSKK